MNEAVRFFCTAGPLELLARGGLDISESFRPLLDAGLLENMVFGSADAAANDVPGDLPTSPLADWVEFAVLGVVVDEFEEKDEKTEPSTRFAFSREASFLNSTLNLNGLFGWGGDGRGLRSKGTKPAGRRVICIEVFVVEARKEVWEALQVAICP